MNGNQRRLRRSRLTNGIRPRFEASKAIVAAARVVEMTAIGGARIHR